jgi:hypothetical protein
VRQRLGCQATAVCFLHEPAGPGLLGLSPACLPTLVPFCVVPGEALLVARLCATHPVPVEGPHEAVGGRIPQKGWLWHGLGPMHGVVALVLRLYHAGCSSDGTMLWPTLCALCLQPLCFQLCCYCLHHGRSWPPACHCLRARLV